MTRARALKDVIRARAAKTGERYTTARRHVLNTIQPRTAPVLARPALPPAPPGTDAAKTKKNTPAAAAARGSISDVKVREKTGHDLEHWFGVLDRFGAVDRGHAASARHLYDEHGVPGWYSQGITVAYERARGVRDVNQRCDGEYEVSVSKVLPAGTADVVKAFTDARLRKRWTKDADPQLAQALADALESRASKGFVVRPDGLGRYRYKWGGTIVQLYVIPKSAGKLSVVVSNSKLARTPMVEERRTQWRAALNALANVFTAPR